MELKIQRIDEQHIPEIMKLDKRFSFPWSSTMYRERLHRFSDLSYGAFKNGKMIGFVLGKRNSDGTVLVSRVVVDSDYEGRGIGTKLLEKLGDSVSTGMTSTVRQENIPSIQIHKHVGFQKIGSFTYSDGTPGYRFVKRERGNEIQY